MSGFSPDWLASREAVDHRSRNPALLAKLAAHFVDREDVLVVDLGAGAGSNLRAVAPVLPAHQQWILVDHDPALLVVAFETIAEWADSSHAVASGLEISKDGKSLLIEFRRDGSRGQSRGLGRRLAGPSDGGRPVRSRVRGMD